jgi:hypothetical protein
MLYLGASGSFAIKGVRLFGQAKGYSMHFGIPGLVSDMCKAARKVICLYV